MNKRIVLMSILMMTVSLTCMPAGAVLAPVENVAIDTSGAVPFLYEGLSYLPARSVASFLGAELSWDPTKGQAVINYDGQELALTPGNANALFRGQPVVLTAPPVVVGGRTYVPMEAFKRCYNVPVEWDKAKSEVKIKGPRGWGTAKVNSRPPWHGGPPPWAPAWGERRKDGIGNRVSPGNWEQRTDGVRNPVKPGNQEQRKDDWKQNDKAKGQVKDD